MLPHGRWGACKPVGRVHGGQFTAGFTAVRPVERQTHLSETHQQSAGVTSTPLLTALSHTRWHSKGLLPKKCQERGIYYRLELPRGPGACRVFTPSNKHNPGWSQLISSTRLRLIRRSSVWVLQHTRGCLLSVGSTGQEGWRVSDNESLHQYRGHHTKLITRRQRLTQLSRGKYRQECTYLQFSCGLTPGTQSQCCCRILALRASLFMHKQNKSLFGDLYYLLLTFKSH